MKAIMLTLEIEEVHLIVYQGFREVSIPQTQFHNITLVLISTCCSTYSPQFW